MDKDGFNSKRDPSDAASKGELAPCYLFIGQRPLTGPPVRNLIKTLVGEGSLEFNLEIISQEACTSWAVFEAIKTRPFSPGIKVVLLQDPPFLTGTGQDAREDTGGQDWDMVFSWLSSQKDIRSVIVIESGGVDKRIRVFSTLKRLGPVIDMGLGEKGSRDAKTAAAAYINGLFKRAGKKADSGVMELILDQVGDDPVALGIEVEKLISLTGAGEKIVLSDVRDAVSRQREEEIFRLSEALSKRDKPGALEVVARLLANDVHPLAVFQTVTNFIRKMALILTAFSKISVDISTQRVSYSAFQKEILPKLKAFWGDPAPYVLKGAHPYGLYLMCKDAHTFRLEEIIAMFARLYEIDLALKGGHCPARVVLERLVLDIIEE